jgi:hypothetical protein
VAERQIQGDRRLQRRYPVELDLEFRIIDDDKVVSTGAGKTGNISSGGVLFHAEEGVPSGPHVELAVRWPAVLGNSPFLELRIFGRLVRNDSQGVAMRMSRYHFEKLGDPRGAFEEIFTDAVIPVGQASPVVGRLTIAGVRRTMTLSGQNAHSSRIPEVLRRALAQVPADHAGSGRQRLPDVPPAAPLAQRGTPLERSGGPHAPDGAVPRCHSKHNAAHVTAMARRTRARQRGQLWLSDELEVAPVPVRLWPMRLRQMDLF